MEGWRDGLPRCSSRSCVLGIAGPDLVFLLVSAMGSRRGSEGPGMSSSPLLWLISCSSFLAGGSGSRWFAGTGCGSVSAMNSSALANICGPYQPSASSPRFLQMSALAFHEIFRSKKGMQFSGLNDGWFTTSPRSSSTGPLLRARAARGYRAVFALRGRARTLACIA